MKLLVAYESKHGATHGIAEAIAAELRASGFTVDLARAREVVDVTGYDAFVIGSAVYYGTWLREALDLITREREVLRAHPVWLFSSGPIGAAKKDEQGRDVRNASVPKSISDIRSEISPRAHHVFFGALDKSRLGLADKLIASMPAFPGAEGDFRDWKEIRSWAAAIARDLAAEPAREAVAAKT